MPLLNRIKVSCYAVIEQRDEVRAISAVLLIEPQVKSIAPIINYFRMRLAVASILCRVIATFCPVRLVNEVRIALTFQVLHKLGANEPINEAINSLLRC